jgi:hypothetical protein
MKLKISYKNRPEKITEAELLKRVAIYRRLFVDQIPIKDN